MKKSTAFAVALSTFGLMIAASANAREVTADSLSFSLSGGASSLRSTETLQSEGKPLSDIRWKSSSVTTATARSEYNDDRWRIGLSGTTSFDSKGSMDDKDSFSSNDWDAESHHDARVKIKAFDVDASFWALNEGNWRAGPALGYRQNKTEWTGRDGTYSYLGKSGSFSGDVVNYSQEYKIPWAGFSAEYNNGSFQLDLSVKASPFVSGTGTDNHLLRSSEWNNSVSGASFGEVAMKAAYSIDGRSSVYFTVAAFKVKEKSDGDVGMSQSGKSAGIGFQYSL